MDSVETNYFRDGFGRFVKIILPNVEGHGQDILAAGETTGAAAVALGEELGIQVGHQGGSVNFLEFIWTEDLDTDAVNRSLNRFLSEEAATQIRFSDRSGISFI